MDDTASSDSALFEDDDLSESKSGLRNPFKGHKLKLGHKKQQSNASKAKYFGYHAPSIEEEKAKAKAKEEEEDKRKKKMVKEKRGVNTLRKVKKEEAKKNKYKMETHHRLAEGIQKDLNYEHLLDVIPQPTPLLFFFPSPNLSSSILSNAADDQKS